MQNKTQLILKKNSKKQIIHNIKKQNANLIEIRHKQYLFIDQHVKQ